MPRLVPIALAAIVVIGAGLRIAGAWGSLWFDEIWSLQNLDGLSGPGDIIWGISQDNNHFLNSLWLWVVGPNASSLSMRAMAIAFGIGSIVMAARIVGREAGVAGALTAALLFAVSPLLVQYGSEARGYSGMVFGLLWAFDALVRVLARPDDNRPRLEFALAMALGSLSHVQMIPAAGMLVAAAVVCVALRTRDVATVSRTGLDLAIAFVIGVAPVALAVLAGVLNTHTIRFGDQTPFSVAAWIEGLAGAGNAAFGLPGAVGSLGLLVCAGIAALALNVVRREFAILTGALVFAMPLLEAAARMPNVHIPRFHLACALGLLLLVSAFITQLWDRAGLARSVAICLMIAFGVGAAIDLAAFLRLGRGDPAGIVRAMGDGTFATDAEAIAKRTVRFNGPRVGAHPEWIASDRCDVSPDWFLHIDDNRTAEPPPPAMMAGPVQCRRIFSLSASAPYVGLSGFRWSLYKRAS